MILFCLVFLMSASAHVEHAEAVEGSFWYQVFIAHDWLHPVFFILLIYTCYYFRFFSGRKIGGEPRACIGECSHCYHGENVLKRNHRWIFWMTFFLLFIHIGEAIPAIVDFRDYSGLDFWILATESAYLIFAFFYLITCYHFRYCVEMLAKRKVISYKLYNELTNMNNKYHGIFLWSTLLMVVLRFLLVIVDTGSVVKAIPGMF